MSRRIVAVSDFCTCIPPLDRGSAPVDWPAQADSAIARSDDLRVVGGYLERLPLAAVASGLADTAEIWSFSGRDGEADSECGLWQGRSEPDIPRLTRRLFRADPHVAPYESADALAHLDAQGAPDILCIWGLGVAPSLLEACPEAIRIYNSIDAEPLRIPDALAACIDLFLTGAEWQSQAIRDRVPDARTLVLPIGPEFASDDTFHPTGAEKDRDVVYVACAQDYKRHDILFDALSRNPGLRALLVIGYGHLTEELHAEIARRGLDVEVVGPPGVSHDEVNRQINRARIGVVCGQDDGAPAILTEYQLAGLPVLANADLTCGLDYVTPEAGLIARPGAEFAEAMVRLIAEANHYNPRPQAIARWGWQASVARLSAAIDAVRAERAEAST